MGVVFFGGLDAWVLSGGRLCGVRRRIGGVWVADAAWVRSDGSFSRRRHVTAGGDARRRPVVSERERESGAIQRERVCGRGGFRVPSPNAGPLFLFGILFLFFCVAHITSFN